jgi:glycerol-3-phosphate acyltransferase PlsY
MPAQSAYGLASPQFLAFLVGAFLAGSLPFSLWTGQLLLRDDIRRYGDANPGATNVFRAGGAGWRGKAAGILAVLLDGFKAAIPAGIAWIWLGFDGWPLALISVAPIAGHAFSPFLGFKGGKAVASTGGTWTGLTAWEGVTLLGLGLFLATRFLRANGWAVMVAMVVLLGWYMVTPPAWNGLDLRPSREVILVTWGLNMLLLIWTHRDDLRQPPQWRARSAREGGAA